MKALSENKKAYFNYEILEKFEAGIALLGHEVKSIKLGRLNLAGTYIVLSNEEVFLIGALIPPYQPKNTPSDYNPTRSRKLLLKKSEIKYLIGKTQQIGLTLVPLRVYTKRAGRIKIEFGLVRGRKKADKREVIKKREVERGMRSSFKKDEW